MNLIVAKKPRSPYAQSGPVPGSGGNTSAPALIDMGSYIMMRTSLSNVCGREGLQFFTLHRLQS